MAQIKIFGLRSNLKPIKSKLSDIIHSCVMESLKLPADKRAHRFINLDKEDFYYPGGRSERYIIIEIMMISGRSVETKKKLIKMLFREISEQLSLSTSDIEIAILDNPTNNWGFRGMTGDEIALNYPIEI